MYIGFLGWDGSAVAVLKINASQFEFHFTQRQMILVADEKMSFKNHR